MRAYHGTTVMFISFVDSDVLARARTYDKLVHELSYAWSICHIWFVISYFSRLVLTHVHIVCIHVIHMCQYTNPLITLSFIHLHDDYDISQYTYYHYDLSWSGPCLAERSLQFFVPIDPVVSSTWLPSDLKLSLIVSYTSLSPHSVIILIHYWAFTDWTSNTLNVMGLVRHELLKM